MDSDEEIDEHEPESPLPPAQRRLLGWRYAWLATVFVVAACFSAALAVATNWSIHRGAHTHAVAEATPIVVGVPQSISGPALTMALPEGCSFSTKQVDANGGNWWFSSATQHPLRILIATSRLEAKSSVDAAYFQQVVAIVEQAAGDRIIGDANVQTSTIDHYTGERGSYDLFSPDVGHLHAEALLLRREHDDLFIVIYGDIASSQQLKAAAQQIFGSLIVGPTPPAYDLHSA